MFRIFGIITEIGAILAFFLGLVVAFYIYTLTLDVKLPPGYLHNMEHFLTPFVTPLREMFGVSYSEFNKHKIEMSYGLLAMICFVGFGILFMIARLFYKLHSYINLSIKQISHFLFTNKAKKIIQRAKNLTTIDVSTESSAIVAIILENIEKYPSVEQEISRCLERITSQQKLFVQGERIMLKFNSTLDAVNFIIDFCNRFTDLIDKAFLDLEHVPAFRIAIQSLASDRAIGEEEAGIWSLLKCAGANQVFMSARAKEQIDIQKRSNVDNNGFEIVSIGDYSQLGNRTFEDLYRLHIKKKNV